MVTHTFCNKLKQKSGGQLYFKLKQAQERSLRCILRGKKDLAVVTQTTDIQTKMIFVEGKNMSFMLHPKYEPHQPTPSIPSHNKQGFKQTASEYALIF